VQTTTEAVRGALGLLIASTLVVAMTGCRHRYRGTRAGSPPVAAQASVSAAAPPVAPAREPPIDRYEVMLDIPPKPGKPAPEPSESVLAPFRVWVNQESPMQKKTPEWRSYPAKEGASIELAPDGKWRCLLNPVRIRGKYEETRKLDFWAVSRTLRCSSDGWATYVEGLVSAQYDETGKREHAEPPAAMYLKDIVGGVPRSTVVVLEVQPETGQKKP